MASHHYKNVSNCCLLHETEYLIMYCYCRIVLQKSVIMIYVQEQNTQLHITAKPIYYSLVKMSQVQGGVGFFVCLSWVSVSL